MEVPKRDLAVESFESNWDNDEEVAEALNKIQQ
jgi:hypothetical protein